MIRSFFTCTFKLFMTSYDLWRSRLSYLYRMCALCISSSNTCKSVRELEILWNGYVSFFIWDFHSSADQTAWKSTLLTAQSQLQVNVIRRQRTRFFTASDFRAYVIEIVSFLLQLVWGVKYTSQCLTLKLRSDRLGTLMILRRSDCQKNRQSRVIEFPWRQFRVRKFKGVSEWVGFYGTSTQKGHIAPNNKM